MAKKLRVDRIEGNKIVAECEDKSFASMDREVFPEAKEGDILIIERSDDDSEKINIKQRFDRLKAKNRM